jgi:cytochrome c oxidase assembly protein subunit 15
VEAVESQSSSTTLADYSSAWLRRFTWATAGATLFLICSGGMVTSKGVGLAVPDWPTTFGYNMFLFPVSRWVGGIFFEHTHRLIASTVGLLTIILAVWLWLTEHRRWVRNLGWIALGAVVLQGVLGGLRVTMLKDEIGIFHACLAQGFFGLLVFIAIVTSRAWEHVPASAGASAAFRLAVVTTTLIFGQVALGAAMRHQHRDLAILDFPTAYGNWIPVIDVETLARINAWRDARGLSTVTTTAIWLQMTHRFVAVAIAAGVVALWLRLRRVGTEGIIMHRLSNIWMLLVMCQLALGAWTIWSNKAADIATAHVAVGAVLLATGVALSAFCWRAASPMAGARTVTRPLVNQSIQRV